MSNFRYAYAVTPVTAANSSNLLSPRPAALYVGGAGKVRVLTKGPNNSNTTITFNSVPAGTTLYISPFVVLTANTTATGIVALY